MVVCTAVHDSKTQEIVVTLWDQLWTQRCDRTGDGNYICPAACDYANSNPDACFGPIEDGGVCNTVWERNSQSFYTLEAWWQLSQIAILDFFRGDLFLNAWPKGGSNSLSTKESINTTHSCTRRWNSDCSADMGGTACHELGQCHLEYLHLQILWCWRRRMFDTVWCYEQNSMFDVILIYFDQTHKNCPFYDERFWEVNPLHHCLSLSIP